MKRARHNGFTLVELLVVLVIMGVMMLVIGPTFTTGTDMTRVKTASRGIMQMCRYARTMAVLYQSPMVLMIASDGTLRVQHGANRPDRGLTSAVEAAPEERKPAALDAAPDAGSEPAGRGGASYVMADLEAEKQYEQIRFLVTLDEDQLHGDEIEVQLDAEIQPLLAADDEEVRFFRIPFESNGRCLPFIVKVQATGSDNADYLIVYVDRFGSARVKEDAL